MTLRPKTLAIPMLVAALWASSLVFAVPISYWPLDDGAGIVATNSVGGGPSADLRNGAVWVAGRFGNAISFDGANDYLNVVQNISETQNTVSLWVKSTVANGAVFSVNQPEQGGANDRNVWLNNGNISGRLWAGGPEETITTSGTNFADGAWHNVVHQYGPGVGHRLYVDGTLRASGTTAASAFNWQTNLQVGWSNLGGYLNGQVDDVAVWDEVIPERYIRFLAAGNRPLLAAANWTGATGAWETTANWSSNPTIPGPSHDVAIANGGTAQITAATGTANPGMLIVGGAGAGTLSLNGGTLSTQSLTVGAGGTLSIAAGTLSVPAIQLEGGTATVAFTNTTAQSYNVPITGSGSVIKSGAGVVTLSGTNSYTGSTLISEGTLRLDAVIPSTPLSGALLWLDASDPDPTHIVKDGSGYVSAWKDAAGGAGQIGQSDPTRQPLLVAGQINGLPVVRFSTATAADQLFNTTNYPSPVTVFSISRLTGGANNRLLTSYNNNWLLGYWGGGVDRAHFDNWVNNPSTGADTLVHMYEADIRGSGQNSDVYVFDSRTPSLVLLASNTGGTSGPNGLALGGWGSGVGEAANGDVGEMLIYSGILTTAQRQSIENYLIAKWIGGVVRVTDVIPDASPVTIAPGATLDLNNCSETIGPLSGSGNVLLGAASLTVNGTANAVFSGPISGTGGLIKLGAGSQTLSGANTYTGPTTVRQGTLDLGSNTAAGSAAYPILVGDTAGLAATLTLGGGSLTGSYATVGGAGTGTLNLTNTNVTLSTNSGNGTLAVGLNGTGTVTQTGGTVTANNGYIMLGRFAGSQGTYTISGGTLQTAGTGDRSLYMAWDSSSARGYLNVSGTAQVNLAGNLNVAGQGTATVTQTGGTVSITDNGLYIGRYTTGVGTYTISAGTLQTVGTGGDRSLCMGWDNTGAQGILNISGTANIILNGGRFEGAQNGTGTVNQTGGTLTVRDGHIVLARGNTGTSTYNISAGLLQTAGTGGNRRLHLAWDQAGSRGYLNISGTGQVVVNADNASAGGSGLLAAEQGTAAITLSANGSLTVRGVGDSDGALNLGRNGTSRATFTQTGGTATFYDNFIAIGRWGSSSGTLTVNGGTFTQAGTVGDRSTYLAKESATASGYLNVGGTGAVTLGGSLYAGVAGTAAVTMTGGSLTVPGSVVLAQNATASATLALNGGVLTAGGLSKGTGTAAVSFDGGTLKATSSFTTTLPMTLNAGGGTLDTNGNTVALTAALTGPGGLTKTGSGLLALGETCSYGGPTRILGGTVQLGITQPVAGRSFWLDASQAGTLTYDGSNKVSQWRNADNAAQTTSQANSAAQPTLLAAASGINGLPAVSFNVGGIQTYLLSDPGAYANATSQLSVFMVGRQNAGGQVGSYAGLVSMNDNWANPDYDRTTNVIPFIQNAGTANSWGSWRQNGPKSFGTIPAPTSPFLAGTIFDGTNDTFYVNGTAQAAAATTGNFAIQAFSVGTRYYFSAPKEKWNGDLGELLFYNRALTAGERELVTAYLTRKWLASGAPATANYLPTGTALSIAQGATLDLSGTNQTVASLADASGGGGTLINSAANPVTFVLNPPATTSFSGCIGGGSGGAIGLVLNGPGTQILSGANTYTGGTTIQAGTLRVYGSILGPVAGDGGWLIGAGTVGGPVTVGPAGHISAGDSPGHLVLGGNYVQLGTMLVEIAGPVQGAQYDWIEVHGTVDFQAGSFLDVNFLAPFVGQPGEYFDVVTASGGIRGLNNVAFDFSGAHAANVWWMDLIPLPDGSTALRLTVSPEPASLTLLALGALALL